MTPIRQAVCTTLAGLAFSPFGAAAAQTQAVAQPPAPVVRVLPRPQARTQSTAPAAVTPRSGTAGPARPATAVTPRSQVPTPGSPAEPGSVAPVRRPRPVTPSALSGTIATPQTTVPARVPARPPAVAGSNAGSAIASRPGSQATGTPARSTTTAAVVAERKPAGPALSATGLNRNVIVLDPAHGGADSGGRIGDTTLEKNVTLALAFRLRSLLVARGFTVVLTREGDAAATPNNPAASLSLDDRAGIADHARAAACLLLHATGRGTGVHLYNSDLEAAPDEAVLLPWLTAQAAWVPASQALEQQVGAALGRSHIALVSSTASVRPVNSLTCPALVLELAPETDVPGSVNDAGYQERVAAAIAGALVFWQNAVQPPHKLPPPPHIAVHHTAPALSPEAQP